MGALAVLGRTRHDTIAIGDAENDHSMLEIAEVGVAVANAVPSLKQHADLVLAEPDGTGIVELCASGLLEDRSRLCPVRRRITLGITAEGESVTIPGSMVNLLIAGSSGAGKSFVTVRLPSSSS